jgi:lysophospholipase L1-like esterase
MLHGPDPCYVAPDTQLSDAVAFLHTHHNAVTLVTVDLGFNTLDVCLHHLDIDLSCVTPQLALLRQQLGQVMRALTRAAGPNVTFIGLGHYNPYLTKSTKEGAAEVFAGNSVVALRQMNRSLSQVYGSFKVPIADIATAFHEQDSRVVHISKKEATTVNVQYECKLTWMCAPKPFGPNIHPNDSGYLAIANAIAAVLPPKL